MAEVGGCVVTHWPDRLDELESYWERGLSGTQIAQKIPGATRASVLAAARRWGLEPRAPENAYYVPRRRRMIEGQG